MQAGNAIFPFLKDEYWILNVYPLVATRRDPLGITEKDPLGDIKKQGEIEK